MPRIESFSFGSIVIGSKTYGRDILILPDGTIKRRRASTRFGIGSHVIKKGEINELVKANPEVVVVGTGTNAWAQLASDAELCVKEAKIELIALPSEKAAEKFNQLTDEGKKVAALIHITC